MLLSMKLWKTGVKQLASSWGGAGTQRSYKLCNVIPTLAGSACPAASSAPMWAARGRQGPPGTLVSKESKVQAHLELNCSTGSL